jgi:hypothetical protein
MGDSLGGSGWEVRLPDGATEKYYVKLPDAVKMESTFHFANPPTIHQGEPLDDDMSVEVMAEKYIGYLRRLVGQATARFRS